MREFTTLCRDTKTNGSMVLSETSYNNACFWLAQRGFECETARSNDNTLTEIIGKLNGEPMTFLYDEDRGYLILKGE